MSVPSLRIWMFFDGTFSNLLEHDLELVGCFFELGTFRILCCGHWHCMQIFAGHIKRAEPLDPRVPNLRFRKNPLVQKHKALILATVGTVGPSLVFSPDENLQNAASLVSSEFDWVNLCV